VRWRSGGTGGQNITLTHTITNQVFYFSGTSPLIKEWNAIDDTIIVRVAGDVTLFGLADGDGSDVNFSNTSEVDNWTGQTAFNSLNCSRDNDYSVTDFDCIAAANVDGTVLSVAGSLVNAGDATGFLIAPSRTFIEYAFGSHVNYDGPIDGVRQTFTISGTCGSALIEDPETGLLLGLDINGSQPLSTSLINSDKGVAFQIFPTDNSQAASINNADCRPGDSTTITITSQEDVQLRSDLDTAPPESITIVWVTGLPTNKQPILAWAGQRVVLEHNWRQPDGSCPLFLDEGFGYVQYSKQAGGPGGFAASLLNYDQSASDSITAYTNDDVVVRVEPVFFTIGGVHAERERVNTDCISTALYESEDPGEVDVQSYITDSPFIGGAPQSQQVVYLVYYMKFESVTLGIVDGNRAFHNAGSFAPSNPWDASKDKTEETRNVSADSLVRVRVKGWFTNSNPTGRAAGTDSNNGGLPAGRWVMPDDWNQLAGGTLAASNRPNYDIMISPAGTLSCSSPTTCQYQNALFLGSAFTTVPSQVDVVGPFSLLDGPGGADSNAPYVPFGTQFRNTWLPDRVIDMWDAPMPPALVRVSRTGSGFVKLLSPVGGPFDATTGAPVNGGADKFRIYSRNPYYHTHIPAEPWISPLNSDGSGYLWNSWGSGINSGVYKFWYQAGAVGTPVLSAPGKDLCPIAQTVDNALCTTNTFLGNARVIDTGTGEVLQAGKVFTGGYTSLSLYSDNHGEVMAYINGDAGLTMDECSDADSLTENGVVAASAGSVFCEKGDKVGSTTVAASADYPDKRKHYPLASNTVKINWTWGGIKSVDLQKGAVDQFVYVVFHVKDRDGFCSVPVSQFVFTQINADGTVTLFPLFVRTSTTQPLVSNIGADARTPPAIPVFPSLPPYAGYAVPGGLLGGSTGGSVTFPYQATTTDTGYPYVTITGAYSLHPVLGEQVNWQLDVITGGSIVGTSDGTGAIGLLGQSATTFTFDTADPNAPTLTVVEDNECQAWVRLSNSLLGVGNILVTAFDPEGTIQFDRVIDFQSTASYTLSFRWSLITWAGANNIPVSDALKGTGANEAGNDIFDQVTAVYGWDQAAQEWLGFFPSGVNVPGANDLADLDTGQAYWIAIKGPSSVTWTIATNVS
jgi:hypothetical protein